MNRARRKKNGEHRVVNGIDLVSIAEIRSSLKAFGTRFLERVFTPHEIDYSTSAPHSTAERLAARFAAKEACRKILRPADRGIGWSSIEVRRAPEGWCELVLHGEALARARAAGLSDWSVSLTHEDEYAAAIVTASKRRSAGKG